MRFNGHFAKALRREMKAVGMTSGRLAALVGVRRVTVYGWLGGVEPAAANMARIITVLPALKGFAK